MMQFGLLKQSDTENIFYKYYQAGNKTVQYQHAIQTCNKTCNTNARPASGNTVNNKKNIQQRWRPFSVSCDQVIALYVIIGEY